MSLIFRLSSRNIYFQAISCYSALNYLHFDMLQAQIAQMKICINFFWRPFCFLGFHGNRATRKMPPYPKLTVRVICKHMPNLVLLSRCEQFLWKIAENLLDYYICSIPDMCHLAVWLFRWAQWCFGNTLASHLWGRGFESRPKRKWESW